MFKINPTLAQIIIYIVLLIFSEEVRFHDPSEFAEKTNQEHVNYGQAEQNYESHNDHEDHRHGIGEDMDKE